MKASPERKAPRRSKSFLYVFLLIISLLGSGYFLWDILQKPSRGAITEARLEEVKTLDHEKEIKYYSGEHIAFQYPGNYTLQDKNSEQAPHIVESLLLLDHGAQSKKIAIILANRASAELSSDPSFQLRMMKTQDYVAKKMNVQGQEGVLFEKKSGTFEETLFFFKEPYIVSISLSSLSKNEELEKELEELSSTMKWQK